VPTQPPIQFIHGHVVQKVKLLERESDVSFRSTGQNVTGIYIKPRPSINVSFAFQFVLLCIAYCIDFKNLLCNKVWITCCKHQVYFLHDSCMSL
jgi:amino acid permease